MYNPFNKTISEIEYNDLEKLIENEISEGWYVEYKGSFPKKNKKIADSIASFANSEGGWYIVGIEEDEKESKPSEIIGFDLEDEKKPADKITNIVKDNVDPIPYFESKIIEISENKVVLVVQVFEGYDAPYISNGKINIRVGETSKPVAIDDRYQFEKLLEKKENYRKKVESFMDNRFYFVENYSKPYLEFYVYVDNPKEVLFEDFYSDTFFKDLKENFNSKVKLTDVVELSTSLNFDNIYGSVDSYVIRQVYDHNPVDMGLTLELFKEGHLKLIYPFKVYNKISLNGEYESLMDYNLFVSKFGNLKIIDLAESILEFQTILSQYKRILNKFDCNYELNFKYKFNNFDSITPFMDSKDYMKFIFENNLPINFKTSIEIPNGGYKKCQFNEFNPLTCAIRIIEATGLPRHLIDVISEGYAKYINIKSALQN